MYKDISMEDVLGFIMAAGTGERLRPLTEHRAKAAVPIAGNLRIIDFVLTNFVRSGLRKNYITIYYKSDSLSEHIDKNWSYLPKELGEFIKVLPPQKRTDEEGYGNNANAIFQNIHVIEKHKPKLVAIFAADHVYYMDIRQMMIVHDKKDADLTICTIPLKISEIIRENGKIPFGVIVTDNDGKVLSFQEKPEQPTEIPNRKGYIWASMGNYLFKSEELVQVLKLDHEDESSNHDFGHNIIPKMVSGNKKVYIYDFSTNYINEMKDYEKGFWMDLGTKDSYYEANMMFREVTPKVNLYSKWAIRKPPTKMVFSGNIHNENDLNNIAEKKGEALDSIIGIGTIISGATVLRSVIFSHVRIHDYSRITDSILLDNVDVGENCKIKNAVIEKHIKVPNNTQIGYDLELDKQRGLIVSDKGRVFVPGGYVFK